MWMNMGMNCANSDLRADKCSHDQSVLSGENFGLKHTYTAVLPQQMALALRLQKLSRGIHLNV